MLHKQHIVIECSGTKDFDFGVQLSVPPFEEQNSAKIITWIHYPQNRIHSSEDQKSFFLSFFKQALKKICQQKQLIEKNVCYEVIANPAPMPSDEPIACSPTLIRSPQTVSLSFYSHLKYMFLVLV